LLSLRRGSAVKKIETGGFRSDALQLDRRGQACPPCDAAIAAPPAAPTRPRCSSSGRPQHRRGRAQRAHGVALACRGRPWRSRGSKPAHRPVARHARSAGGRAGRASLPTARLLPDGSRVRPGWAGPCGPRDGSRDAVYLLRAPRRAGNTPRSQGSHQWRSWLQRRLAVARRVSSNPAAAPKCFQHPCCRW
jgi:hypothetical protein